MGALKYFLGIEVMRSNKGIFLSHRKYVLDLLDEIGLLAAKPCETRLIPNINLKVGWRELLTDPERYWRTVGKINHLTVTRPDIAFSISIVTNLSLHLGVRIRMMLFTL